VAQEGSLPLQIAPPFPIILSHFIAAPRKQHFEDSVVLLSDLIEKKQH
jgi:hypothetical protein